MHSGAARESKIQSICFCTVKRCKAFKTNPYMKIGAICNMPHLQYASMLTSHITSSCLCFHLLHVFWYLKQFLIAKASSFMFLNLFCPQEPSYYCNIWRVYSGESLSSFPTGCFDSYLILYKQSTLVTLFKGQITIVACSCVAFYSVIIHAISSSIMDTKRRNIVSDPPSPFQLFSPGGGRS